MHRGNPARPAPNCVSGCTAKRTRVGLTLAAVQRVKVGLLAFFSVAFGLLAYGPLQNLWSDYQDSPTSTYLEYGLPPLTLCVVSLVGLVLALRRR